MDARGHALLAARAWPPLEEVALGGWRLRFAHGVTRRANSVLPLGPDDGGDVEARIDAVERAYRAHGLPPRFQLFPAAQPADLDARLERRGYAAEAPTLMLAAPLRFVADTPAITVSERPSAAWLETWWAVDGRGGESELAVARAILERIEPQTGFAEVHEDGAVAAVGLGILDGSWLGVYCMATQPRARRRGHARAVLGALGAWAATRGGEHAHLSVMEDNGAALALYASLGFAPASRYRYRTLRNGDV